MSTVLRICVALCMAHLAACDGILGIHEIVPEESPTDPAARPTQLSFVAVPSTAIAQRPLGTITVIVQDGYGRTVNRSGKDITLSLRDDRSSARLLGTLTATAVSDTVFFNDVSVDRPGTGFTLVASGVGLMSATSPLDVLGTFTLLPVGDGGDISTVTLSAAPPGGTPTIFAAAGNGVYTSRDGGMTWMASEAGGDVVGARVVADPQHPGVAYLGSRRTHRGHVLLKTEDGGESWRAVGRLSSGVVIYSIAIDPKDASRIYALAYYGDGTGLYLVRSTDGGENWDARGLPGDCVSLEIDPVTTSNLYCTGTADAVYKSSNAGVSWVSANTGLGGTSVGQIFATPDAVFALASGELFRSTNGAASWTRVSGAGAGQLAYAPSMPRRIYLAERNAEVSVSNDAGASFGSPVPLPAFVSRLAVHPTNPDVVYAATTDGVLISSNAGASWSPSSRGITALPIFSVASVPGTTGTLLASTPAAVVRSTDGGTSWTTVSQCPRANIVFDPVTPTTAYVCGGGTFGISTDSGASFSTNTSVEIGCEQVAFAGTTFFVAGGFDRLRKSTNRGASWTDIGLTGNALRSVALGDGVGNVVLAGSASGIHRSTDGGTSFTQIKALSHAAVFADPQAPSHVLASGLDVSTTVCTTLLSMDGGATFSPTGSWCASTFSAVGSTLYAKGATFDNGGYGLYSSTDRGRTWTRVPLAGSLPDHIAISSVAMSGDGTLYLGTSSGLYRSINR
jgi:photosystem II stability/assembly factor-like uncharacterized protein